MTLIKCAATFVLLLSGCRFYSPQTESAREWPLAGGIPEHNLTSACVSDYRPGADYFPDKASVRHARIFSVSYHLNYKVVRLRSPRTVAEETPVSDTLVLVQCGTPVPPLDGELAGAAVVTVPIRTAAANDQCDVAALTEIGIADRLVAVGGRENYNAEMRARYQKGELATIGYAWHEPPNLEIVLSRRPDVLLMRRATLEHAEAIERARKLGIKAVPTLGRSEPDYLGFAEWTKYFALFANAEAYAEEKFRKVEEAVEQFRRKTPTIRTKAVWANYDSAGFWTAARNPEDLRVRLLRDAGAENLLYDDRALLSGRLSTEAFTSLAAEADLWITESMTVQGWPDARPLQRIKAWRDRRIYHHQGRSDLSLPAYDWYETGAIRPDLVLKDLADLLAGREAVPGSFFGRVPIQ